MLRNKSFWIFYFFLVFCGRVSTDSKFESEHSGHNVTDFISTAFVEETKVNSSGGQQTYGKYAKRSGADWIAEPLRDALWAFMPRPTSNNSDLCSRHVDIFRKHLSENRLWAVQMLDASASSLTGVLASNSYQMGHFDQCLEIDVEPDKKAGKIQGQYCLAKIVVAPSYHSLPDYYKENYIKDPYEMYYEPLDSVWKKMKPTIDPTKRRNDEIYWAVCVPASCSPDVVETSLKEKIHTAFSKHGIDANITLNKRDCYTNSGIKLETGNIVMLIIILMALIFVIISSAIDFLFYLNTGWYTDRNYKKGKLERVLLAFSVYQNMKTLNKPDPTTDLNIIHGIRVYSTILVMIGHRFMFSYGSANFNIELLEHRYRNPWNIFILNGFIIVDSFFTLSGFLTCYIIIHKLRNNERITLMMIYLNRLIRILPLYTVVILLYIYLLPLLGNGPLWNMKTEFQSERCRYYWWANLLFINNYTESPTCMFQTWYISSDMQFFLVGPILIFLLNKKLKTGISLIAILMLISIIVPFIIIYRNNLDGIFKIYIDCLHDPLENPYVKYVYIRSHNRAGPYLVGLLAGYLYYYLKIRSYKFTNFQLWLGSIVFGITSLASLTYAWLFFDPYREYNSLENALYASLHRIFWAASLSWVVIVGGLMHYPIVSDILCAKSFVPLSKLTYGVFLVHALIQIYCIALIRVPEYLTYFKLYWMWLADVASSFIIALVLHLLFEAPIHRLIGVLVSIFLEKGKSEKTPKTENSISNKHNSKNNINNKHSKNRKEKKKIL